MDNLTPVAAPPKKNTHQTLFIFLFGLVLGIAIFSSYHYYQLAHRMDNQNYESTEPTPVFFNISEEDHIWGAKDAKVTLVVFSDLACPYSREYFANLQELMNTRADQMRIVWRHLPVSLNNVASVSAAIAAECAGEQGKFFEYIAELYPHQDQYGPEFYAASASELGLNVDNFSACVSSGKYDTKIEADYNEGLAKNIAGTPASFLDGRYLPGALPLSQLEALIDPLIK
ncbi:MAG TPA: thioredoxin domain-containing protein [Patescibacteria group bacterium]|nr:thioredoxin domain-containing protein [Patescibacteria group bacterium]